MEVAAFLLSALTLLGGVVLLSKKTGSDSSGVKETLANLAKQQ